MEDSLIVNGWYETQTWYVLKVRPIIKIIANEVYVGELHSEGKLTDGSQHGIASELRNNPSAVSGPGGLSE